MLVLARLADFQVRDSARKERREAKTGGQWVPPPGFNFGPPGSGKSPGKIGPPTSGSGSKPSPSSSTSERGQIKSESPLPFPLGSIPNTASMPSPNSSSQSSHHGPSATSEADLVSDTEEAEKEWTSIQEALFTFRNSLGSDYDPLPADIMTPVDCSFGETIFYRTYSIAIVWSHYYTGHILLHRCHPSMPSNINMAMGIAAPRTAQFANMIGRIMSGLVPRIPPAPLSTSISSSSTPTSPKSSIGNLNPALGAALIELTIPIFFAGIQLTDNSQRQYVVQKSREISRLTGWGSARLVATGCELAWDTMYARKKGPKYERAPAFGEVDLTDERETGIRITEAVAEKGVLKAATEEDDMLLDRSGRVHFAVGVLGMPRNLAHRGPPPPRSG
jgi:hypothetical protein